MEISDVGADDDLEDEESEAGAKKMEEGDNGDEMQGGIWKNGIPSESEDKEGEDEEVKEGEGGEEIEELSKEEKLQENLKATPSKRKGREETTATNDLQSTLQKTREEDLRKGKAVMRRLVSSFCVAEFLCTEGTFESAWDCLLDARICIQKAAVTVNKVTSVCPLLSELYMHVKPSFSRAPGRY